MLAIIVSLAKLDIVQLGCEAFVLLAIAEH